MASKNVRDIEYAPEEEAEGGVGRHMGLLSGTFLVTGYVIGSGIFASPGEVIREVGSVGLSLILWVAGGVLATFGAMAYAELGSMFPKNGADQVYLSEAFHPILGLGYSMSNVIIASTFIQSAMVSIFGEYLHKIINWDTSKGPTEQPPIAEDDWMPRVYGIIAVVVVAVANMVHKKAGTAIQNVFTFGKLAAMGLIIVIGFVFLGKDDRIGFPAGESVFKDTTTDVTKVVDGLIFALFGYTGFQNLNNAAGELKNPKRNLPLSVILSMLISTALYFLANMAYFAVLGGKSVAGAKAVALLLGSQSMGMGGVYALVIGVILSIIGAVNCGAIGHSRLIMAAADDGIWMPRIMGKVSARGTPIYALIMNIVLTVAILVAFKDYKILTPVACFIQLTYYALSNAACIWLRYKQPDAERGFKVPLVCPAIFTLLATSINVIALVSCKDIKKGLGYGAAVAFTFLIPAVVYYIREGRSKKN